jgi:hypothetical protein
MSQQSAFVFILATTVSFLCVANHALSELPDPDGQPADMSKPVQVFILMGQSNMLGFGKVAALDDVVKNNGLYPYLQDDAGNWTVRKDVRNVRVMCSGSGPWKTYQNEWMTISNNIGPEIGIGHHVGEVLDAPVLILKSCIGNRSLGYDLLPPSAPRYEGNKDDPSRTPQPGGWYAGVQYDGDTKAAKDVLKDLSTYYPDAKEYEIAGFFFWQGAKDLGKGGSAEKYEENLVHLIKDLRKDFNAPDALFVCATMGQAKKGSGGAGGMITDAQLAVDGKTGKYPEFKDNVATFYSNPVSKGGSANGHYGGNPETYMNVGEGMGAAMAELLKKRGKSGGGSGRKAAGKPAPAKRAARTMSPEKSAMLDKALLAVLTKLDVDGKITPVPMPLSLSRSKLSLVAVAAEGALTFQAANGKTANFEMGKLNLSDKRNLAVLVAKLKPESGDAMAMVGVYQECLGNVDKAERCYEDAGSASRAKLETLFD